MRRAYELRLYPSKTQARALDRQLALHRQLYNAAIEERREAWRMCRTSVSYGQQAAQLKEIRLLDEDLALMNHTAGARTLKRVERAYQAFFRRVQRGETPGYPRFKGRSRFQSIDYEYGDGTRLIQQGRGNPKLYVQHVGEMRVRGWREPPEGAVIKEATIKERAGRWYAVLKWEAPDPVEIPEHTGPAVGVDAGLVSLLALSDDLLVDDTSVRAKDEGALVVNKRFYQRAEQRLAEAQRVRTRRKPGSARRRKAVIAAARASEKVARQRRDLLHKLARRIVTTYSLIVVEDLDVRELVRHPTQEEREQGKKKYSKSIHDAGWGMFLELLESKAVEAGSLVVKVNPAYTSQECSECGERVPKGLKTRRHVCACGVDLDRDVNAARVILARGLRLLQLEGGPVGAGGLDPRRPLLASA